MNQAIRKQEAMIIIRADLRHRSLIYDLNDSDLLKYVQPVNLMDDAFKMFGFSLDQQYSLLKEMYLDYVYEKLESLGFDTFWAHLNLIAEELYMLLNTIKKLMEKGAIST